MKKHIARLLATVLLLSAAVTGVMILPAAAEEAVNPTFSYDFTGGLDPAIHNQDNQISFADGEGYVTFRAEGDDPYFRFADGCEPNVTTEKLAFAVIKYRTTAAISSGEFFTNRHSGPQWGGDRTWVKWSYKNDGQWHAVIVDTTDAWGGVTGDTLYAFRFDPLASGAKAGDTIDVAYIHFFADFEAAAAFASVEFPDDVTEPETDPPPVPEHKITFMVDGKPVYNLTYKEGDTAFVPPVVPIRPGYEGRWSDFTLGKTDLVVEAIYTATATETVPPMPETEAETETVSVTEAPTAPPATETAPPEIDPPVDDPETGCGASLAFFAPGLLMLLAPAALVRRKE